MFRHILCAVLLGSLLGHAQARMPTVELTAGMYRIDAEVAATDRDRQLGLMQRTEMAPQQGMLFIFAFPERHCMWMKNTLLPLSVAFLDDKGVIVNIEDMEPQTENNHCAANKVRFALEMNKGWFQQRHLQPGTQIRGIDKLPPATN